MSSGKVLKERKVLRGSSLLTLITIIKHPNSLSFTTFSFIYNFHSLNHHLKLHSHTIFCSRPLSQPVSICTAHSPPLFSPPRPFSLLLQPALSSLVKFAGWPREALSPRLLFLSQLASVGFPLLTNEASH